MITADIFDNVPEYLIGGLLRYFNDHLRPGGFLSGVLQNDLVRAVQYGTDESIAALPAIVRALTAHARPDAWGSKEAYEAWVKET